MKTQSKKAKTASQVKKDVWKVFSEYIRTRDALKTTGTRVWAICITCDKRYSIKAMQAGHFIAGRKNSVLFEETNVHSQCYACNMYLAGNSIKYFRKMQELYGDKEISRLEKLNEEVKQFKVPELLELKEVFKEKLKGL